MRRVPLSATDRVPSGFEISGLKVNDKQAGKREFIISGVPTMRDSIVKNITRIEDDAGKLIGYTWTTEPGTT